MHRQSNLTVALLIFATALLIRGGVLWGRLDGFNDDPDAYRVIAETLSQTDTFGLPNGQGGARPTAFRPPLYPWILSFLTNSDGQLSHASVAFLHWILGSLSVVLAWDIARRLLSRLAAMIAAALVTIDPILLWQSTLVMTETLAAFLAVAVCWWWVVRLNEPQECKVSSSNNTSVTAGVLGVLLSLAYLCRPTFLVWAVAIIPVLGFVGPVCRVRRSVMVLVSLAILGSVMATWTTRNLVSIGHPVWATSHGGYTLLLGNNDSFYDYLRDEPMTWPWESKAWDAQPFFDDYAARQGSGDEVADDRVAYELAKTTIRKRSSMFVYSCWVRLARLWQPFPHATEGRSTSSIVAVGSFYLLIDALIVWGLIRNLFRISIRRLVFLWPALALVLTLSVVHTIYWSNPRMRAPAIPILAIAASAAFLPRDFLNRAS